MIQFKFLNRYREVVLTVWRYLESKKDRIPVEELKRVNRRSGQLILRLFNEALQIMIAPTVHWAQVRDGGKGFERELRIAVLFGICLVFFVTMVGHLLFNSLYGVMWSDAFKVALSSFLILILHLFFMLIVANQLAFSVFRQRKTMKLSRRLVIYSILPFILVMLVTGVFPFLAPLNILALYSFYLLYTGIRILFNLNEQRNMQQVIVAMAAFGMTSIVIHLAVSKTIALIF